MPQNKQRFLFGPEQSNAIRDLLQSIFVAELLSPSKRLWFFFGWISDVEILDNQAREFSSLEPDWPAAKIRLSQIMVALLNRGSAISLILREDKQNHNKIFIENIKDLKQQYPEHLKIGWDKNEHNKAILGDDFLLYGSMNLTYYGITINGENISMTTESSEVEEFRLQIENKWNEKLK